MAPPHTEGMDAFVSAWVWCYETADTSHVDALVADDVVFSGSLKEYTGKKKLYTLLLAGGRRACKPERGDALMDDNGDAILTLVIMEKKPFGNHLHTDKLFVKGGKVARIERRQMKYIMPGDDGQDKFQLTGYNCSAEDKKLVFNGGHDCDRFSHGIDKDWH